MPLFFVFIAGCASTSAAPISYGSGPDRPPASSRQGESRQGASAGAPAWADGEGTPLSAYALRPQDAQPRDLARLPRSHRVGENESLYDVAARYQIPLLALIEQNQLEPPYALAPGRVLQLPPPRFHTVARGESFEEVARRYNVDRRSLALLNRVQPPHRVSAGDRVLLPALAREIGSSASSRREESRLEVGGPTQVARFTWPLRGEVLARFGAQQGGARLDGIEIAGREGAEIAAAGEGDVVYAGADLAAYGTLVLVRHPGNYVTAYGYARRALVGEGQHVRAGQPIAELGSHAGGRARLLFQVRQGAQAVDPAPLLGQ